MPKHKKTLIEMVRHEMKDHVSKKNKKKKKKRKTGGGQAQLMVGRIASMIANPCGPIIQGGQYCSVEGSFARVHNSFSIAAGVATSGYAFWCPDYTPDPTTGSQTHGNLFVYTTSNPNWNVANSLGAPFGSQTLASTLAASNNTTPTSMKDPGEALASQDLVQDVRCLSACIRLTPTGKLQNVSGQYAIIESITLESLMPTTGGLAPTPIDRLFNFANDTGSITKDPMEVKYRPSASAHVFRGSDVGAVHVGIPAASISTFSESAQLQTPQFCGIAWRGLDVSVGNPFVLEFIKNVEIRLRPIDNMGHQPPRQVSTVPLVEASLELLDKRLPGWQSEHSKSFGESLAEIAMGAAGSSVLRAFEHAPGFLADTVTGAWGAITSSAPALHEIGQFTLL